MYKIYQSHLLGYSNKFSIVSLIEILLFIPEVTDSNSIDSVIIDNFLI